MTKVFVIVARYSSIEDQPVGVAATAEDARILKQRIIDRATRLRKPVMHAELEILEFPVLSKSILENYPVNVEMLGSDWPSRDVFWTEVPVGVLA